MKQLITALVLLIPTLFFAQVSPAKLKEHAKKVQQSREKNKVVTSLDTIFVGGTPYALLVPESEGILGYRNYTVYNLDGVDLIYITYDMYDKPNPAMTATNGIEKVSYRIFKFLETEEECEIRITLGQDLDEIIAKNNLIDGNALDKEAAHKFVVKQGRKFSEEKSRISVSVTTNSNGYGNYGVTHGYGSTYSQGNVSHNNNGSGQTQALANQQNNALVERNRSAHLYIFGDRLQQDFKDIGYAKEETKLANGKSYRVIKVTLPDGTLIAEAKGESFNSSTLVITTLKDNRKHTISYTFGKQIEEVANYLIEHYYL